MSNKATDEELGEMVPVSSRLPRRIWTAMKREAVDAGVTVQDLLDEACRDLLAKRGKPVDGSTKGRTK